LWREVMLISFFTRRRSTCNSSCPGTGFRYWLNPALTWIKRWVWWFSSLDDLTTNFWRSSAK
jgi:hypothetical protein